jgi:FtsZ-interacting cell division protein ZipA
MSELRWALLAAGILFIAALLAWEFSKRRRRASEAARPEREAAEPVFSEGRASRQEPSMPSAGFGARDPVREPRVVEFDAPDGREPALGDLPVIDSAGATVKPAEWAGDDHSGNPPPLVLAWPPESERIILALRLVPRSGERFLGVSVRQALVGEGFQHGEFSIFHKPLGDGRVILSIASLTRPGTFDPAAMDGASFAGLNLFAVLPGPLPGRESFERLLLVGRTLAQRLRGDLLDQRGLPLDEARLEELRRDAAAVPAA